NAVRLWLHTLAYNLGNFLRTLATPEPIKDWSLTSLKGQADQDRRESREPRPLCRLPDGRGRHRTANVPGDFAADRRTAAEAAARTSMRRSMVMRPRAPEREDCGQMPRQTDTSAPRMPLRARIAGHQSPTGSVLPASRENHYHPRQVLGSSGE